MPSLTNGLSRVAGKQGLRDLGWAEQLEIGAGDAEAPGHPDGRGRLHRARCLRAASSPGLSLLTKTDVARKIGGAGNSLTQRFMFKKDRSEPGGRELPARGCAGAEMYVFEGCFWTSREGKPRRGEAQSRA